MAYGKEQVNNGNSPCGPYYSLAHFWGISDVKSRLVAYSTLFADALNILVDGRNVAALHLLRRYEGRLGIVLLNLLVDFESFVVFLLAFEQEACFDEVLRASGGIVGFAGGLLERIYGFVQLPWWPPPATPARPHWQALRMCPV